MNFISSILLILSVSQAQDFYKKGEYRKALDEYVEYADSGISNPELYFDIGNCYYNLREYGKALLNYRRAWFLCPGNPDIRHNISLFTTERKNPNPFIYLLSGVIDRISLRVFSYLLIITSGLLILLLSLWLIQKIHLIKFPTKFSLIFIGIFFIFSLVGFSVWMGRVRAEWVVFTDSTTAHSGPGEQFKRLMHIDEAEEGSIIRKSDGWWLIHLHSGDGGWVDSTSCSRILSPERLM